MKTPSIIIVSLLLCTQAVTAQEEESRFRAGEWDLSPFLTYVDKTGDKWGVGASATYFVTKNIGIGASTYWADFEGTFFDNVAAEAYFRLPLFKRVSPYAVGSIGRQFETSEWVETFGAGVDYRAFKRITAFGDIQYRIANKTSDGVFVRLGARITF